MIGAAALVVVGLVASVFVLRRGKGNEDWSDDDYTDNKLDAFETNSDLHPQQQPFQLRRFQRHHLLLHPALLKPIPVRCRTDTRYVNSHRLPESGGIETKPLANGQSGNRYISTHCAKVVKQLHD